MLTLRSIFVGLSLSLFASSSSSPISNSIFYSVVAYPPVGTICSACTNQVAPESEIMTASFPGTRQLGPDSQLQCVATDCTSGDTTTLQETITATQTGTGSLAQVTLTFVTFSGEAASANTVFFTSAGVGATQTNGGTGVGLAGVSCGNQVGDACGTGGPVQVQFDQKTSGSFGFGGCTPGFPGTGPTKTIPGVPTDATTTYTFDFSKSEVNTAVAFGNPQNSIDRRTVILYLPQGISLNNLYGQVVGGFYQAVGPIGGSDQASAKVVCQLAQASVLGDPQFSGFLGQSFQVHGQSEAVYNIISTPHLQYNALFQHLDHGKCRKGTLCYSHPGNYFGEVGLLLKDQQDEIHKLHIVAGGVHEGMKVKIDDQMLTPTSHEVSVGSYKISMPNEFELVLESDELLMRLENSDMFINQDLSIGSALLSDIQQYKNVDRTNGTSAEMLQQRLPHGILGQTWKYAEYPNRFKYIQGQLYDYIVIDGLFGTDFLFNRF